MRAISHLSVGFAVLGLGGVASANAFLISEHDAKAVGRGDASTATDADPSAIAFNIGGLAVGQGTNVMIGGSLIMPTATFNDPSGTKTDAEPIHAVLPHFFLTSRVNDVVAVGLGFHAPFGLEITWPDAIPGVANSSPNLDVVKSQSLRTYFITPSIGANLDKYVPGLSIGAGLDLVPATVELTQYVYFGDTQGQAHLGGNAFGIGGRIGAMFKPAALPELSVGVMWRSQVNEDFSGKADFDIAGPFRDQLPPDGNITTSVAIPQSVAVGVAYRPVPALEVEANAVYVNWAKFKEIRIHLPNMTDSVSPQNYEDTYTIRAGAEYKMPKYNSAVRVGYIYDPTPIPVTTLTAQLPDANRHCITAGVSFGFGNYGIHAGGLYVLPESRATSDAPYMPIHKGSFDIQAFVASLTLDGHFGR